MPLLLTLLSACFSKTEPEHIYFATDQQSEWVLQKINTLGDLKADKKYSLELAAGTYEVSGKELIELKDKMTQLDKHDGTVDGVMSDFYQRDETVYKCFDNSRWKHPVFMLDFDNFTAKNSSRYQSTKSRIANEFQNGNIFWTAGNKKSISDYQDLDITSLTEAALENNYSAETLSVLDKELDSIPYRLTYQMTGIGSGIASSGGRDGLTGVVLAIGASTLLDIKNAPDDTQASQALTGWIRHEFFHSLMSRFGYETSPNGKDRFAETVAIKAGQVALRAKIIAKLSGDDELRQFEYFTQEACEPIILSRLSQENWTRRKTEREKLLDTDLQKEVIVNTEASGSVQILEKAWSLQSLRATGVNSQKIDDLDSKYRAWISANNPDGGIEFYDDCLTWLGYAQLVASSPEFSDYARMKSPTFFNAF